MLVGKAYFLTALRASKTSNLRKLCALGCQILCFLRIKEVRCACRLPAMCSEKFLRLVVLFLVPWIGSAVDYEGALADLCLKDATFVQLCLTLLLHIQVVSQRICIFFGQARR